MVERGDLFQGAVDFWVEHSLGSITTSCSKPDGGQGSAVTCLPVGRPDRKEKLAAPSVLWPALRWSILC